MTKKEKDILIRKVTLQSDLYFLMEHKKNKDIMEIQQHSNYYYCLNTLKQLFESYNMIDEYKKIINESFLKQSEYTIEVRNNYKTIEELLLKNNLNHDITDFGNLEFWIEELQFINENVYKIAIDCYNYIKNNSIKIY